MGVGSGVNPYSVTGRVDRLRTVTRSSVPRGTRSSGPGVLGAPPASAKASVGRSAPSASSGRQCPARTSSATVSTPPARRPAGRRLSLGTTSGAPAATSAARVRSAGGAGGKNGPSGPGGGPGGVPSTAPGAVGGRGDAAATGLCADPRPARRPRASRTTRRGRRRAGITGGAGGRGWRGANLRRRGHAGKRPRTISPGARAPAVRPGGKRAGCGNRRPQRGRRGSRRAVAPRRSVGERIAGPESREAGEVCVRRVDLRLVFDRERREVGVGRQVPGRAQTAERREQ